MCVCEREGALLVIVVSFLCDAVGCAWPRHNLTTCLYTSYPHYHIHTYRYRISPLALWKVAGITVVER